MNMAKKVKNKGNWEVKPLEQAFKKRYPNLGLLYKAVRKKDRLLSTI